MANNKTVWSDEHGDMRKSKKKVGVAQVNESQLLLEIRRMTSGKGRAVVEIKGLPNNDKWCKQLAKDLKKSLGVGGTYKNGYIEIHGEKIEDVMTFLDKKAISWKKTGG